MPLSPNTHALVSLLGAVSVVGFGLMSPVGAGGVQSKSSRPAATSKPDGAKVFAQMCASCHGAKGEGGPGYSKPLTGNRTPAELSKYIASSMPPGKKHCPADASVQVASYVYDSFYSPIAQERIRPARISLSRLTVKQFQNSVSDLIGPYRPAIPAITERGLDGEYFKSRDFDKGPGMVKRRDATVDLDFGNKGPLDGYDGHAFSIMWQGSVIAPETGEYDFIVHTDHATRLYLNHGQQPVIDAWVKSGKDTEYRGSAFLIGGRAYYIRLDFFKATQGVDDSAKAKTKPSGPASISLAWRRPHRAEETIPTRFLLPVWSAPLFVTSNPFPADDRSMGYERGNAISKEWDDAVTASALDAAKYVSGHISELANTKDQAGDRKEKVIAWGRDFVSRAFRSPLSPELETQYVSRYFSGTDSVELSVKKLVLMTLKSPRFLYREVADSKPAGFTAAANLSFALWDTIPDTQLISAAASGQLNTPQGVREQAERMVQDPRAWHKLQDFLMLWLKVDEVKELVKSSKAYPEFDEKVASDLRTSLEMFLESIAWGPKSDYRELMTSSTSFLNGRLSKIYGGNLPKNAPFQPVAQDVKLRRGVLTQPYLLSHFAYLEGSSPIHRGVLIARNMLGRTLSPPPVAFAPLAASLHPGLTTRQRVAMQTKPEACSGCHSLINPLGFALEKYDAIGRVRAQDNGKPVDTSGSYVTRAGTTEKFDDAADLSTFLASSDEAHAAFIEKLFHHLVKQPVLAIGQKELPKLQTFFDENQWNIRKLMVQIATDTALSKPQSQPIASPTKAKPKGK